MSGKTIGCLVVLKTRFLRDVNAQTVKFGASVSTLADRSTKAVTRLAHLMKTSQVGMLCQCGYSVSFSYRAELIACNPIDRMTDGTRTESRISVGFENNYKLDELSWRRRCLYCVNGRVERF
jgi:hypothetical protein